MIARYLRICQWESTVEKAVGSTFVQGIARIIGFYGGIGCRRALGGRNTKLRWLFGAPAGSSIGKRSESLRSKRAVQLYPGLQLAARRLPAGWHPADSVPAQLTGISAPAFHLVFKPVSTMRAGRDG